jgi:hypothetical protein
MFGEMQLAEREEPESNLLQVGPRNQENSQFNGHPCRETSSITEVNPRGVRQLSSFRVPDFGMLLQPALALITI